MSWSTSPSRALRQQLERSQQYRKSPSRELHFRGATGEHRSQRSQSSRRASLTIEPGSSISNQWYSLFTDRLLYRNPRRPSSPQAPRPQTVSRPYEDMTQSPRRRTAPDSSEAALPDAQSIARYNLAHRSGICEGEDYSLANSTHSGSKKHTHGPQSCFDDNTGAAVHHFSEQYRPRTRGKHGYEVQRERSAPYAVASASALDNHYQKPMMEGYAGAFLGEFEKPLESPHIPRPASCGAGAIALQRLNDHSELPYASFDLAMSSSKFSSYARHPSGDGMMPRHQYQNGDRHRPSDKDVPEGHLDVFDLELLESMQLEEHYQLMRGPSSRHNIACDGASPVDHSDAGLSRAAVGHLLHIQPSTCEPTQFLDDRVKLHRPTLHKHKHEEVFNPYKKPHLFA